MLPHCPECIWQYRKVGTAEPERIMPERKGNKLRRWHEPDALIMGSWGVAPQFWAGGSWGIVHGSWNIIIFYYVQEVWSGVVIFEEK